MNFLYDIGFFIFALFYLPLFFLKGKWNKASLSRLGIIPQEAQQRLRGQNVLWLHAVSVGEVGVAVGFLNRLRDELRDVQVLLTTTTVTGYGVAQKIKNEEDVLLYFPADFRFAVRSFVKNVSPAALILFETEIWPNLISELSARGVPVVILNGRLSEGAFARYRRIRPFLKKTLSKLSAIGVQDERMRERFAALGASVVTVTGNLKFDWMPPHNFTPPVEELRHFCRRPGEFLWVAGSTHEGEEERLFDVCRNLKEKHAGLRLLIAPRHLHRVSDIENTAARKKIVLKRLSAENCRRQPAPDEVWLLDQMGVLAALYEAADAVFVGGSLVPVGGHNLVEPAYFAKPVLFGPHMQNFLEMANEFKKNGAGVEVRDAADLERKMDEIIESADRRRALGRAAKRLVERHQGATERNKDLLLSHWQPKKEKKLKEVMG